MAYKKYIKRGGKVYGPYIYHSKRIGGKVISEYHGQGKPDYKLSYKKILLAIFGVIFFAALIFLLIFSEKEMTGKAIVELEREVQGQVSANETFNYTLQEGERAELKPLSVETDSKQLSDSDIELKTEGNEVLVTTAYSEINYSETNESLEEEIFPMVYFVLSILSEKELEENITEPESEPEIPETETTKETDTSTEEPVSKIPETDLIEETNISAEETEIYIPEFIVTLTEQEKEILIEEVGNTSVKVKEFPPERGFIKVRYEFGDYWVEFNYDADLSRETLESFKNKDMTKWLKDIAKKFLEEPEPEPEFNESTINF